MSIRLKKTNSKNTDFIRLVKLLDSDLAVRNGEEQSFYAQYNKIALIKNVIVVYENDVPIGCGAFKEYETGIAEVKRMYTLPDQRGKGIATTILSGLENWASELGYSKCILETGKKQSEAIALYKKNGYANTSNYGQYVNIENSVCFEKTLK